MDSEHDLKRILVVTGIFPPDIGGPATYVPKFAQFLVNNGFSVKVVTLGNSAESIKGEFAFEVIPIFREKNRFKRLYKTLERLRHELTSADFVFCNGLYYETAIALRSMKFKCKNRSVVKVVGNPIWERSKNRELKIGISQKPLSGMIYRLFAIIEEHLFRWSLRQFDQLTSPGWDLAKSLKNLDSQLEIEVIQNGVQIPVIDRLLDKPYDLVTVSRLVPWKNIDHVIDLAKLLNCSLAIVGEGPSEEKLRKLATTNHKIEFFGKQTPQRVAELMQQSKVFCQLSDYEGLSFSLLQAMSFGLPCVVSSIAANQEAFISDPGAAIYYNKSDFQGAIQNIRTLLESNSMQRELGSRSRVIVLGSFTEERQLKKMMELLLKNA